MEADPPWTDLTRQNTQPILPSWLLVDWGATRMDLAAKLAKREPGLHPKLILNWFCASIY